MTDSVTIDPTHLAAAWETALGYPLQNLDGSLVADIHSDFGRAQLRISSQVGRFQEVTTDYDATLAALRDLHWALIGKPRDAVIRITAA